MKSRRFNPTAIPHVNYSFEMIASRGTLSTISLKDMSDPTDALRQLKPSRIDMRDNRDLTRIDPPEWETELEV